MSDLPPITPRTLTPAQVQAWKDALPTGDCWECPATDTKITRSGRCISCTARKYS